MCGFVYSVIHSIYIYMYYIIYNYIYIYYYYIVLYYIVLYYNDNDKIPERWSSLVFFRGPSISYDGNMH